MKIKYLKIITSGQRCIIVGAGPSINNIDLKKLKRETIFMVNRLFMHKDYESIKLYIPLYYRQ